MRVKLLTMDVTTMYLLRCGALALLAGFAGNAMAATLDIGTPWMREPAPTQSTAAIYFQLRNSGPQPMVLDGARVTGATSAAVHEHLHVDGLMRMREAGPLTIAPGATLTLEPGGYHLMVFGLETPPRAGEQVPFCLHFVDGSEQCAAALVKAIGE
ncbi:MAG: copper chaperone PCu(A)C, partial [Pseudomonadales bacterium]|nr:copper chaperone PCu(A)C [Pseudomonadales bacterium]